MQVEIDAYHQKLRYFWSNINEPLIPGFSKMPYLGHIPTTCHGIKVLFFGINPSFVKHILIEHWNYAHPKTPVCENLLALEWNGPYADAEWNERRAMVMKLDQYSRLNYDRYYGPFKEVAEDAGAGQSWQHIDAFPLRHTSQKTLKPFLPVGQVVTPQWKILAELLDATLELAKVMRPKVIVVANSHLSKVLQQHLGLRREPNGHRYQSHLFPGVPFLLSSQLSGGATSTYGRERLVADLRDALSDGKGLNRRIRFDAKFIAKARRVSVASALRSKRTQRSPQ